jgi:hypothetical protein
MRGQRETHHFAIFGHFLVLLANFALLKFDENRVEYVPRRRLPLIKI